MRRSLEGSKMISDKGTHGCSPMEVSVSANDKIDDRLEDDRPRCLICAPCVFGQFVCIVIEAKSVA